MKVICFGDSNTWGYDPRGYFGGRYDAPWPLLLEKMTDWEVNNDGQNGRMIPGEMPPCTADLLIVMLGTNDLLQGFTPEQACRKMEAFLRSCQVPVLLIAPPHMKKGEWVDDSLIHSSCAMTQAFEDLASRLKILFCDAEQWRIPIAHDGVHFTESGHRIFAENLIQYLKEHL